MSTEAERLETAVARVEADSVTFHTIIHGTVGQSPVTTEGGPVKTVAKAIADLGSAANYVNLSLTNATAGSVTTTLLATQSVTLAKLANDVLSVLQSGLDPTKYQGLWTPGTDTPMIPAAGAGNNGQWYFVVAAGTATGNAAGTYAYGDCIVSNATTWLRRPAPPTVIADGSVVMSKLGSDVSPLLPEDRTSLALASDLAYAILDTQKRVGLGIRHDGKLVGRFVSVGGSLQITYDASGHATISQDNDPTLGELSLGANAELDATQDGAYGDFVYAILDANRRIGFGVKLDGTIVGKLDNTAANQAQIDASINAAFSNGTRLILPGSTLFDRFGRPIRAVGSTDIVAHGDSLTEGAGGTPYPSQLAALIGRPVYNAGVGGERTLTIMQRMLGGVALAYPIAGVDNLTTGTIVPLRADTIAGLVSAKTDAVQRVDFFNNGVFIGSATTANGSGQWIFNWHYTGGTWNITARAKTQRDSQVAVIWAGRNDVRKDYNNSLAFYPWQYVADRIVQMVDHLKTADKRFIVMTPLNAREYPIGSGATYSIESANSASAYWSAEGQKAYEQVVALSAWIRSAFPDNHIDIRQELINAATLPGDAQDVTDDVIPTSLRADHIHLNTAGYGIVAARVRSFIQTKGW